MQLASPALVLAVPDMNASQVFLETHLGYEVAASGEDFTALAHKDHDLRIIVSPLIDGASPSDFSNTQVGFVVTGIDEQWERLKDAVRIGDPIQTIDLGAFKERYFQVIDPNGITYRLLELVS